MNYKWIGAVLIVCACGMVGFSMAVAHRKDEKGLRQLIGALDYMACELQYRLTPLPDLCRQAGREYPGVVGSVLIRLSEELECQLRPDVANCMDAAMLGVREIPEKVKEAFVVLGSSLGRFDAEGQLQGLEAVRSHCRRNLEELTAGRDNRLRSYQTLGICAGAALAILFV